MTDDVRKLLGGYATGTLSDEEKKLLFDSALHDDELFAALADEQILKEMLDDSGVRADLLRATGEPRFSVGSGLSEWFLQPKAKVLVTTGLVLVVAIGVSTVRDRQKAPQVPVANPVAHDVAVLRAPPPAIAPVETKPLRQRQQAQEPKKKPEPQPAAAHAVAPPAPPAAAPAVLPLQAQLLRREPDGSFRPTAASYEFGEGDQIRLRLTSIRTGSVAISQPGQPAVRTAIVENQPVDVPAEGTITISPATTEFAVVFSPLDSETLMSAAELQNNLVAGAAPSATTGGAAKARRAGAGQIVLRVPIRQKEP